MSSDPFPSARLHDADATWWRQAAVYQIYPRSFADASGDGLGDLRGITSRIGYLADLGIDAVWISPFYPSALADGGYDVDDYRDVDPRLGTLDDFDAMLTGLHEAGIRVIIDIVPNHTSNRHRWFTEALASPKGSPARQRYLFRDGLGPHGELPPSDWTSIFGGRAWEPVGDGQWYMHFFAAEQPDLNWANPEVNDEFLTTLAFWADRGVDGFRIDVAHMLVKDIPEDSRLIPSQAEVDAIDRTTGMHPFDQRAEVHEIYATWRQLFNRYDPPRTAVAEAWVSSPVQRARFASPESLGQAFNFDLLEADFDADAFRTRIDDNLTMAEQTGSSSTWVLSNHDVVRHATRYGLPPAAGTGLDGGQAWLLDGGRRDEVHREQGTRRARAAIMLLLALPGSTYMYQGEELGLHEVGDLAPEVRQDPAFFRNAGVEIGRDGCRVPLPWSARGNSLGFSCADAATPHLPQPQWFADVTAQRQADDPASTLSLYRQALHLRRALITDERLEWLDTDNPDVLAFARPNGWVSVTNFGDEPAPLPAGRLLLSSAGYRSLTDDDARHPGQIPPETTVWLRR